MKFRLVESQVETDSEGNELSQEQIEFFKNSKIRDKSGKLLVCYHGSPVNNIDVFNSDLQPMFFSADKKYASGYTSKISISTNKVMRGKVYAVYLNIKNSFDLSNDEQFNLFKNEYIDYIKNKKYPEDNAVIEIAEKLSKRDSLSFVLADSLYSFLRRMKRLNRCNYDGIIFEESVGTGNMSYVPLNANQIKSITNKNPSNSNNINENNNNI